MVVLLLFDVVETEPLFVCDTVTEFELVDDADPLVTVAVDDPVFDPELVFEALPPVLPVELPLESPPPPMLPPLAWASPFCSLEFEPVTSDDAELPPEFAFDDWWVSTFDPWSTLRIPPVKEPLGPSPLMVLPDESEVVVTPPEFDWVTLAELVLPEVASPDPLDAIDVPELVPVLPLVALPPVFPAVLPELSPSPSPPM